MRFFKTQVNTNYFYFSLIATSGLFYGAYQFLLALREMDRYPGTPPEPFRHNEFYFTTPVVPAMQREKIDPERIETLVQNNPGKRLIQDDDGTCIVVTGVKNGLFQERGCLKGDDECRVVGLWKMPR